jgi:predicted RNase H-like nuclease (RuvC/YqgF family)
MSNYRETRRSEADWEQFSADQREWVDQQRIIIEELKKERDAQRQHAAQLNQAIEDWKRVYDAEARVNRTLREHLDRLETEVQRLKNIVESLPDGGLKDWNVT